MTNEVNRRDFLKSTAVAGGGVALPGGLQAPEGLTRVTPPTESRVLLRGWMHGGYDSTHPDIWPPSERLGGQAALEKVMALRDRYVTVLHDNYQDYEEGNELTRREDMQGKHEILKVFYDAGQVVGSEKFGDFCVPVMHWSEHNQGRVPGETIPLWQLVFHDAVFGCRYNTFDPRTPYPSWMEDMLYGNFLRFWAPVNFGGAEPYECEFVAGWGRWRYNEADFKSTYHVDEWHARIGLEEMTSHSILTEDGQVEEAVYGNKLRMTATFSAEERVEDGRRLEPHGYLLEG